MGRFIRINDHFIPFHAISSIEDDGDQVVISVRDVSQGGNTIRVHGEAAGKLRTWLSERTAVALQTDSVVRDSGARMDD